MKPFRERVAIVAGAEVGVLGGRQEGDENTPMAVDDRLGLSGRSARVDDPQRVIEGKKLRREGVGLIAV